MTYAFKMPAVRFLGDELGALFQVGQVSVITPFTRRQATVCIF